MKETARVLSQKRIAEDIYDLELAVSFSAKVRPGQFAMVYTGDESRLLGRPISICQADPKRGVIRLVYRTVGAGTRSLADALGGDSVEVLGPLGNGFPVEAFSESRVLLIGGGIGIPPLLGAAMQLKKPTFAVGYRSESYLLSDLEAYGKVLVATEDGSLGTKGNVLDAIKRAEAAAAATGTSATAAAATGTSATAAAATGTSATDAPAADADTPATDADTPAADADTPATAAHTPEATSGLHPDVIFTCGPMPMLRAVAAFAKERGIRCFVSMEERMACGVGACLGCVTKTREVDAHSHVKNARICKEGPVFDAETLAL